jgi:hypothetical protein
VDRAIGCVLDGMKGSGLSQKPNLVCKRKSGFHMRARFSLAGQKPNAKSINLVGSIRGLGSSRALLT